MLVSLAQVVRLAARGGYAVAAFNATNLEIAQGAIAAAVRERSPVVLATTETALDYSQGTLPDIIRTLSAQAPVPIVLHLDHGRDLERIRWCLQHGYTSVMFDGSHLPYRENLRRTAQVVRLAHARRVSVEGELGTIGGREDTIASLRARRTDPERAAVFVRRTGVDVFAPAFGNAHGGQLATERLDFALLRAIAAAVPTPLAFHGASATPARHLRRAIRAGVRKINIDTDLRVAFSTTLRTTLRRHPTWSDPRAVLAPSRDAVERTARRYLRLFGSSGRAA